MHLLRLTTWQMQKCHSTVSNGTQKNNIEDAVENIQNDCQRTKLHISYNSYWPITGQYSTINCPVTGFISTSIHSQH